MEDKLKRDKATFFAQYWGQEILVATSNDGTEKTYPIQCSEMHDHYFDSPCWLELKSLSDISDEDAIEVAKIYEPYVELKVKRRNTFFVRIAHVDSDGDHEFCTIFFDGEIDNGGNHGSVHNLRAYDKLRELSYLVSFREYTPDQLIEMGWAKITEKS